MLRNQNRVFPPVPSTAPVQLGGVVPWLLGNKHDIAAWMDGTEQLDAEPYRAYHVICQLIYLNEGPVPLQFRGPYAGRCKIVR